MSDETPTTNGESADDPSAALERLVGEADAAVHEETREFDDEHFEALRERYESIEGVVQVLLTEDDGRVLLQTYEESNGWHPPGGDVDIGESWPRTAGTLIEEITGVAAAVSDPLRHDRNIFRRAGDETDRFVADVVTFRATVEDAPDRFLDDPTTAPEYHYPFIPEEESLALGWFDGVPDDVDPNHADEVALVFE